MIEKLGITPGPWTFTEYDTDCYAINEPDICDYMGIAHARLIAASPDMLGALIEMAGIHERDMVFHPMRECIELVIEKATGKTWKEIKALIND